MSMDERVHHLFARMPDAKVHLYGKEERPGRKIGHVNIVGGPTNFSEVGGPTNSGEVGGTSESVESLRERAERAAHWLSHAQWTDGWDPHA